MTSLSPKEFKEELRARVADFATAGYLINTGTRRKQNEKEQEVEKMYLKLESWVMEQIHPMMEVTGRPATPEDILENGFVTCYVEPEVSEDQMSLDF